MKDLSREHGQAPFRRSRHSGRSKMPNDAKLGLLVGLGLVIAVAVIYFRNDSLRKREESPTATAVKPASATRASTIHQGPPGRAGRADFAGRTRLARGWHGGCARAPALTFSAGKAV